MGYRSVVALAVSEKMMPHFLGHLSQCEDTAYKFVFMETDKKIEDYDGDGTTMFLWEDIKWYDSFPEVRAITDFIGMNTDSFPRVNLVATSTNASKRKVGFSEKTV